MRKAVVFGAGNIGRGFIGQLFTKSGFRVVFVDVNTELVEALNRAGEYTVQCVDNDRSTAEIVANIRAVDGRNSEAVAGEVAEAGILATAVGVNNLSHIAAALAQGLEKRLDRKGGPVNLLVCENQLGANRLLGEEVAKHIRPDLREAFDREVGFVEVTVGRMVPAAADTGGDPLTLRVEPYCKLPFDQRCWKGTTVSLHGAVPCEQFDYHIRHKLYIHNLGHAVCAYLGALKGLTYVHESAADQAIRSVARGAMLEAAAALKLGFPLESTAIEEDVEDLLYRFGNTALADPIRRVCGDPLRKLRPEDRLVGALAECRRQKVACPHILIGIAAALLYGDESDPAAVLMQRRIRDEGFASFIRGHCGITDDDGGVYPLLYALHTAMGAIRPQRERGKL